MRNATFALLALLFAGAPQGTPRLATPIQGPTIEHRIDRKDPARPEQVTFKVDDTLTFTGVVDHTENLSQGLRPVRGLAGHVEGGAFSMVEDGNLRFARVHVPGKVYRFATSPDGLHTEVVAMDDTGTPECGTGRGPRRKALRMTSAAASEDDCRDASEEVDGACYEAANEMANDAAASELACNGPAPSTPASMAVIDALVVYTDAVARAHTAAEISHETDLSFLETNFAFKLSDVDARLRLARRRFGRPCLLKVSYTENDETSVNLKRLLTPGDQYLDEVARLRTECKADVVMLLVKPSNPDASGMTCIMKALGSRYAPFAQGVVNYESMSISYVFTHELGHMLGAGHNRTDQCRTGMCADSAGLQLTAGGRQYRTMMALKGYRLPNFSDVRIILPNGMHLGTPTANNARTLRLTVGTVSRFAN